MGLQDRERSESPIGNNYTVAFAGTAQSVSTVVAAALTIADFSASTTHR
jgi:hypothetical protein